MRLGAVPMGEMGALPPHPMACQETFSSSREALSRLGGLRGSQAASPGLQTERLVCSPLPGRPRPRSPPGTASLGSRVSPHAAQRPTCARCTHRSQSAGERNPPSQG